MLTIYGTQHAQRNECSALGAPMADDTPDDGAAARAGDGGTLADKGLWFTHYPTSWLRLTVPLTMEQIGALDVMLNVMIQRDGPFPGDLDAARKLLRVGSIRTAGRLLGELVKAGVLAIDDDGNYSFEFARKALDDRRKFVARQRDNARKRSGSSDESLGKNSGKGGRKDSKDKDGEQATARVEQNTTLPDKTPPCDPPAADRNLPALIVTASDPGFNPWRDELIRRGHCAIADAALRAGMLVAAARFPRSDLPTPSVPADEAAA